MLAKERTLKIRLQTLNSSCVFKTFTTDYMEMKHHRLRPFILCKKVDVQRHYTN